MALTFFWYEGKYIPPGRQKLKDSTSQGEKLRERQKTPLWACPQNSHGWFLMRDHEGKDTTLVSDLHILRVCACSWEGHLYRPASASLSECHAKHIPFRFRVQITLWKGVMFSFWSKRSKTLGLQAVLEKIMENQAKGFETHGLDFTPKWKGGKKY